LLVLVDVRQLPLWTTSDRRCTVVPMPEGNRIWRCSYDTTNYTGVTIVNTFHVKSVPDLLATSDESAAGVRDALNTALTTKYKAMVASFDTVNALTVREELAPGSSAIPGEAVATIGAVGTRSASDQYLSPGLCALATLDSSAAIRGGKGRMFMPPAYYSAAAASNGTWLSSNSYWTTMVTFLTELLSTHHSGTTDLGHNLVPVLYSRTRRARGETNYAFDLTGYRLRTKQHFLRSRTTAP
jgi:hypothetical protein